MLRNLKTLKGCTLAASDGEIGKVQEMYFDDQSWEVRYLVVTAGSWLTGRDVLIAPRALGEIDEQNAAIAVHLTQDQVRHAPSIDSDHPVSRQYEQKYFQYYGWDPYWVVPGGGMGMIGMGMPAVVPTQPEVSENLQPEVEPEGDRHLRSSREVQDYGICAQDGELGHISDFVIDDADWCVRYLVVATRNWLPGKHVLLAPDWVERISFEEGMAFVNLPRSAIKDAPEYDPASGVSRAYEEQLHQHYKQKNYWDAVQGAKR